MPKASGGDTRPCYNRRS